MQKQCYVVLSTITKSAEIQRAVKLFIIYSLNFIWIQICHIYVYNLQVEHTRVALSIACGCASLIVPAFVSRVLLFTVRVCLLRMCAFCCCTCLYDVACVCLLWLVFACCGLCLLHVACVCLLWLVFACCGLCLLDVACVCLLWLLIACCGLCLLVVSWVRAWCMCQLCVLQR
jgi:hypothetical protein